jgi:hypothetical protein
MSDNPAIDGTSTASPAREQARCRAGGCRAAQSATPPTSSAEATAQGGYQ